jgi:serine/threonine-protein kinase
MGMVFRGWDPKLQRPVALKTIRFDTDHLDRKLQVSRLLEEAVANARLNHQNIVTVYDYGDEVSAAFIAMELVEGTTLEGYLMDYLRVPARLLIPLAAAVARGLAVAHDNDLVHRDVKPGNVLLGDDGSIKVTDFGISEFISKASRAETIFGTPGYLAPECLEGGRATERSDLFALGVVLYEAATGKHPFIDKTWRKTLHRTVTYQPPPIQGLVPEVGARASEMIVHLMRKEEADRPASTHAVADLFEELAAEDELVWSLQGGEPAPKRPPWRASTTHSRIMPLDDLGIRAVR